MVCVGCQHWFHFECAGLTKKAYFDYVNRNLTFVCDRTCSALMMPFSKLSHNDFMLNFDKTNLYPCGKCKKECLGNKKMNSIECDVCLKWYHEECADLEFTFESYVKFDLPFFCSIKCSMKLLPFTQLKNPGEIEELNYNEDSFPCKVCYEQCLGYDLEDCIQCDFCLGWLHYECSDTPYNDIKNIAKTDKPFSCNSL